MTRYDILSPRTKKEGGTRWFKVGAAFPRDKGGFSLTFDALPLPDAEGRVTLMMWEAQERDERQSSPARTADRAQRPAPAGLDDGDSIPF